MHALLLLSLLSVSAFADPAPDCHYAGSGTMFVLDKATNKYQPDLRHSYQTSATRVPLGNGNYLVQQTKVFNDGRPPQKLSQRRNVYVGPVDASSPDGSVINKGYCSRVGHCFGIAKGTAVPNEVRYTLDYDASGIHLVTAAVSGEFFVDEILNADEPCAFAP